MPGLADILLSLKQIRELKYTYISYLQSKEQSSLVIQSLVMFIIFVVMEKNEFLYQSYKDAQLLKYSF